MTGYGHRASQSQSHVVEVAHNSQYLEIGRARLKKFQQEKRESNAVRQAQHPNLNVIVDALQHAKIPNVGPNATAAAEARNAMVLRMLTKRQLQQQKQQQEQQQEQQQQQQQGKLVQTQSLATDSSNHDSDADLRFQMEKLVSERDALVAQLQGYKEQEKSFSMEIENLTATLSSKDKIIVDLRQSQQACHHDSKSDGAFSSLDKDENDARNCSLKPPESPENREVEPSILSELKKVKQRMESQTLSQEQISEDLACANEEIDSLSALLSEKLCTWDKVHGFLLDWNQSHLQSRKDVQEGVDEIAQAVGELEYNLDPLMAVIRELYSNMAEFREEQHSTAALTSRLQEEKFADQTEISELKQQNQELEKQILVKEKLHNQLKDRLRDIQESVQQTESSISGLQAATSMESALESWRIVSESISSTRSQKDTGVHESLCGIDSELTGVESSLVALVGALNQFEAGEQAKPSQNSSQQALGVPIDWESLYLDMNALQSEILGLDSDKNKLLSTFESQNSLLKEQHREIYSLSQKNSELVSELDSLAQDVDSKRQEMTEAEQKIQTLETELFTLSTRLDAENKSAQEFEQEAEEYKRAHSEATERLAVKEKDVEKLKADLEQSSTLLESQLEKQEQDKEAQFRNLQQVFHRQSDAVVELEKSLEHLKESKSDETRALLTELESTKQSYENTIESLESDNSTLQGKVSSLSAFQASVGTTLCDMTKSMEEVVGNLEATKLCLVAAQTEGDSLREKVAALEDTNEKLEGQTAGLEQRNYELENTVAQFQKEVEAKQSALVEAAERQSTHESKVLETERQVSKLVEELNNVNAEIDELHCHREEIGKSLEDAHQRLKEKEEQVSDLESTVEAYSSDIKQLQEEIKTAKSELATRERVLERSRRELQESQRGWELLKASERKCSELESDIGHQRDENESLKTSAQALEQQAKELSSQLEDAQGLINSREEIIERLNGTICEVQAAKQQSDTAHDSVYEELASSKENMLALERDLVQKLEEARANYDAVTDQLRNSEQVLSERDRHISSLTTLSANKDAEIESLCTSRDEMVLEVQRLNFAVEQYRGKLAQYGAIMGPMQDLNFDLDKLIAALESRNVDRQHAESELEAQLEQSQGQVRQLQAQVSSRDADLDTVRAEADHRGTLLEQSQDQVRQLQAQLHSLDADLDKLRVEADHKCSLLEQEISGLNANLESNTTVIREKQTAIEVLTEQVGDKDSSLAQLKEFYQQEMSSLNSNLESNASVIRENQDVIEKLAGEVRDKDSRLAQLEERYQQELSSLNSDLESKALELTRTEDTVEKLTTEISQRDGELLQLRGSHQQLVSEMNAAAENKDCAIQESEGKIAELSAQVDERRDSMEQLKSLWEASESEYNSKLEEMRVEITLKSKRIEQLEEESRASGAAAAAEEQRSSVSPAAASQGQLMTENEALRQAVAELEEQSLQQAEELRTVREQLQQANAAVHERNNETQVAPPVAAVPSNSLMEKVMLEMEEARAIMQSQKQTLQKSQLEQEAHLRQAESHRAERDALVSKNVDLERRIESQQHFQRSLQQSGGHISSEMEKLEMELKNAYELSEKQRESMEREFCTMMEEERRNWENVVNDMDADMKELRRQLEEKTEQSARGRADHHSGATAAAAEEEEEEGLNAKLAEAEQKLIQKEDELKEAQQSKSELQDYVTALKSAHAHAVAVIESQISRVTGTLPLTSPDNILASLEPDTVRKIMVQQSKHGRWHVELESTPQRESSTRPPVQERPSSSAAAAQPRQHDAALLSLPGGADAEHQEHPLQSQQQFQPHSGLSEGGNSSEDQWERVSNGTAISEPIGNYTSGSSDKAGHGRASTDHHHHGAPGVAKGLVPFAARNLTRLWNLMAGDAPAISMKSQDDSAVLTEAAAAAAAAATTTTTTVENNHHPQEPDAKPSADAESFISTDSRRQGGGEDDDDDHHHQQEEAHVSALVTPQAAPDEFVEVSIDSTAPP